MPRWQCTRTGEARGQRRPWRSGLETFTRRQCPLSTFQSRSGGRLTLHRQEGYAKCQLCKNNQSHATPSHICFSIRNGWRVEGHDGRGNEKMNVFSSSPLRKIQIDPATRLPPSLSVPKSRNTASFNHELGKFQSTLALYVTGEESGSSLFRG